MQDRPTTGAVFLSYASEDAVAAQRICDALRAAGIAVWFDQHELRSGDAWDQKIRRQVRECSLFVPMISMHTAVRHEGYFRLEWDLADQRSHMMARDRAFIVPVCLDQTPTAGSDVPDSFHLVQWTRLPGGNVPADFCSRIASLLRSQQVSAIAGPSTAPGVVPSTATTRPRPRSRLGIMTAVLVVVSLGGWGAFRVWSHRSSGALAAGSRQRSGR